MFVCVHTPIYARCVSKSTWITVCHAWMSARALGVCQWLAAIKSSRNVGYGICACDAQTHIRIRTHTRNGGGVGGWWRCGGLDKVPTHKHTRVARASHTLNACACVRVCKGTAVERGGGVGLENIMITVYPRERARCNTHSCNGVLWAHTFRDDG